jgi:hypothetical protein
MFHIRRLGIIDKREANYIYSHAKCQSVSKKLANHCSYIKEGFLICNSCLTDNHCDAQSDVEQLGEVLFTGGQIHSRAVDKG